MVRLQQDRASCDALTDTIELSAVEPDDFDGAFCLGVTGPIWPPQPNKPATALITALLANNKPVAVIPIQLEIEPHDDTGGILIGGGYMSAPMIVARALVTAINACAAR